MNLHPYRRPSMSTIHKADTSEGKALRPHSLDWEPDVVVPYAGGWRWVCACGEGSRVVPSTGGAVYSTAEYARGGFIAHKYNLDVLTSLSEDVSQRAWDWLMWGPWAWPVLLVVGYAALVVSMWWIAVWCLGLGVFLGPVVFLQAQRSLDRQADDFVREVDAEIARISAPRKEIE